jgi:hypothetical protein
LVHLAVCCIWKKWKKMKCFLQGSEGPPYGLLQGSFAGMLKVPPPEGQAAPTYGWVHIFSTCPLFTHAYHAQLFQLTANSQHSCLTCPCSRMDVRACNCITQKRTKSVNTRIQTYTRTQLCSDDNWDNGVLHQFNGSHLVEWRTYRVWQGPSLFFYLNTSKHWVLTSAAFEWYHKSYHITSFFYVAPHFSAGACVTWASSKVLIGVHGVFKLQGWPEPLILWLLCYRFGFSFKFFRS